MPQSNSSAMFSVGFVTVIWLAAGPAQAQSYVRTDCQPSISADRLAPASLTGRWYKRFWTGTCDGLGGCLRGSPNWNDIVGVLVARSRAADRTKVLAEACRLGPLIGLEWTRPRAVRRIDSGDLKRFKSTLETTGDVLAGIAKVEAQARAKIAAGRG